MTKLRTYRLFTFVLAHSRDGGSLEKHSLPAMICLVGLFCAAAVITAPAQSVYFTTLANFNDTYGYGAGTLVQASDGNLYGTTGTRGAYDAGTIFKTTTSGTLTVLYNFCSQPNCSDGFQPTSVLGAGQRREPLNNHMAGPTTTALALTAVVARSSKSPWRAR